MKIKERIKKWFLEPNSKNLWRDACFLLVFLQFVSPLTIVFLTFINVGIVTPELNSTALNGTFERVGEEITEILMGAIKVTYEAGQDIGRDNTLIQTIVPHIVSYWLVIYYIALVGLVTNVFRYGIAGIYKKVKKK